MEIGKVPSDILERIIFENIENKREEVLVKAGIGEDNAIIDFGEYVCAISTDPITGATKDIGSLAIHISCNDVASSGAEPIAVLMTIMAPPKTTEEDLKTIMEEASKASKELDVEIVGGHTEITDAVNRIVISTTVIGKQLKGKMLNPKEIKVGDKVLMTKYAGIEGTAILSKELEENLKGKVDERLLEEANKLGSEISVVKEGKICGEIGVGYMHDITEGGLLGALWEGAKAINKGIKAYKSSIPILESTKAIANILEINPYKLISSGSMLIITDEYKTKKIKNKLLKKGIKVSIIGEVIEEGAYLEDDGKVKKILPPESDELYTGLAKFQ